MMNKTYAQTQLAEATRQADEARARMNAAPKYSKAWSKACDDVEFWTNKKANMAAMLEKVAA